MSQAAHVVADTAAATAVGEAMNAQQQRNAQPDPAASQPTPMQG